ncbi:MAG: FAD:protein FMN transferase [Candidatus Marinimicrobia bacterium]|nr:FAD:protein FMN transferase [Candidatus Neomarinimicrobiota bacterium]
MGTVYNVTINEPSLSQDELSLAKEKVELCLQRVNKKMNPFDPQSEISKFNDYHSIKPFSISNEFYNLTKIAKEIHQESDGAFDPTIAPLINYYGFGTTGDEPKSISKSKIDSIKQFVGFDKIIIEKQKLIKSNSNLKLDLSAIAKGYGVDKVAQMLITGGYKNFIVEIGGEVFASGRKNNKKWKLGIDVPKTNNMPGEKLQSILQVENKGVATSGDYRNFYTKNGKRISHLINPKTGKPISHNLASVTIVAENCTYADAIATASIILGEKKGFKFVENIPNVEGYFIFRNEEEFFVKETSGFRK